MNLAERADEPSATSTTTAERSREPFDVIVIGAGQAGLAIGYFLARERRRFLISQSRTAGRIGTKGAS